MEGIPSPPLARPSVAPRPLYREVCSCCPSVRLTFRVSLSRCVRRFRPIGALPGFLIPTRAVVSVPEEFSCVVTE